MCTFNSTVKWGQHCSVVAMRRPSKYRKGPAHHWDSVPLPTRWHSLVRSWSQGWWKECRTSQVEGGKCFKVESSKESMKARCWKTRNMHCDFSAGASFLKKLSFYLFIWLCWVLVATPKLSVVTWGWNLGPLHWEFRVLATGPLGKSPGVFFDSKSRAPARIIRLNSVFGR